MFTIHGFKDYCALLFHKGALLECDPKGLMGTADKECAAERARQLRFSSA